MIKGIGNDLIEIRRVLKACEQEKFIKRCFTEQEIELIQTDRRKAADNFAVKESVSKVFGTGFRGIEMKEIEVLRDEYGKPYVNLYGNAKQLAEQMNITIIYVSISNTKEYSIAFAIGEGK